MTEQAGVAKEPGADTGTWCIGADASLQEAFDSPDCPLLLRLALNGALSWQERNRRQVGRALVSPSIAPQWSAALLAFGATVKIEGDSGPLEVPLEDVIHRRAKGEAVSLIVETAGKRTGEAHVGRTPADEPIVAAVAAVEVEGELVSSARIALTGAWQTPVQLADAPAQLIGRSLDEEGIQAVAGAVETEVSPRDDFRGSEEYRRAMAGVLTRRALAQCLQEVNHG
ncbi:FAD binding domain-containing protein [Chloroflexota bacterium]